MEEVLYYLCLFGCQLWLLHEQLEFCLEYGYGCLQFMRSVLGELFLSLIAVYVLLHQPLQRLVEFCKLLYVCLWQFYQLGLFQLEGLYTSESGLEWTPQVLGYDSHGQHHAHAQQHCDEYILQHDARHDVFFQVERR